MGVCARGARVVAVWAGALALAGPGGAAWAQGAGGAGAAGAAGAAAPGAETVVVTGTRFAHEAAFLPYGISVVTGADIRRAGVTTVNEALVKLLGVPARQDLAGGGEYVLDLRGFGTTAASNQIVVVDGVRLSEGDTGGTRLAGIPIDAVERIEVLRGGGTVLYGEGATGGVVIVTTKPGYGSGRRNGAQAYAAYGSHATREARAGGTLVQGDFSLDVAANKRLSHGHRRNFDSDVQGVALTGQWNHEVLRIALQHAQDELESGLPGDLSAAQYAADPRQASTPNDRGRLRSQRQGLLAEATLGGWEWALDVGRRSKEARSVYTTGPYDYDITAGSAGLRARRALTLGPWRHSVVAGVDSTRWDRTVLGAFGSTATQRNRALYLRDELTLPSGLRLSAGLRREAIEKSGSTATARIDDSLTGWELGAVQPLAEGLQAYVRAGNSYRLANADEYGYTPPGTALRPQTARDVELGLRLRHGGGRVEARVYRSTLRDEIGFDPGATGPFRPGGANVNFDPTRRTGLEAEATQRLSPALELRATAGWRQSQFSAGPYAGKDVPLAPRLSTSATLQWQLAPAHQLGGTVYHASKRHPDFANTCNMPSATTLDLRYAYTWQALELSLTLANATDQRYYTQAFGCAAGVTSAIYPEPGRTVTVAGRVRF
jgi:iron complex outermembrane receptor protein